MKNRNSRTAKIPSPGTALLVASILLAVNVSAQQAPTSETSTEKITHIVGRVIADVGSLAFGAGLGPKYTKVVFGVESNNIQGKTVTPVKILYAFFKSDGVLPDSFFDYSKLYELQVARDLTCDESVSSISYEKNVDENGKQLPPSYILRFMDGAPQDVLKPDLVLPCYVLRGRQYRVVRQDDKPRAPGPKGQ